MESTSFLAVLHAVAQQEYQPLGGSDCPQRAIEDVIHNHTPPPQIHPDDE